MITEAQLDDGRSRWTCDACSRSWTAKSGQPARHACAVSGETITVMPDGRETVIPSAAAKRPASSQIQSPPCPHLGPRTGKVFPPKDGAGDLVERGLSAIGITKERWASALATNSADAEAAIAASCSGCERRQKKLNYLGRFFGLGKQTHELAKLMQIEEGAKLAVYACAVYGECLTHSGLQWAPGAPHCCHGCQDNPLQQAPDPR